MKGLIFSDLKFREDEEQRLHSYVITKASNKNDLIILLILRVCIIEIFCILHSFLILLILLSLFLCYFLGQNIWNKAKKVKKKKIRHYRETLMSIFRGVIRKNPDKYP